MNLLRAIFESLLSLLFLERPTARKVRTADEAQLMRLFSPVQLDHAITGLLPYRHPLVRALVIEAKFHKNQKAIDLLGEILREFIAPGNEETMDGSTLKVCLVPVPLGKERFARRGYNQTELICRASGYVVETGLVVRLKETRPQTSLRKAEREANVKGAFELIMQPSDGARYVVVDDVTTTGATLREVIEVFGSSLSRDTNGIALAY